MSAVNQLDCRKCDGWGCGSCRPPAGEQQDVELRERLAAIAAAVKAEREACAVLLEQLAATYRAKSGPHHGVYEAAGLTAGAAAVRARSTP